GGDSAGGDQKGRLVDWRVVNPPHLLVSLVPRPKQNTGEPGGERLETLPLDRRHLCHRRPPSVARARVYDAEKRTGAHPAVPSPVGVGFWRSASPVRVR